MDTTAPPKTASRDADHPVRRPILLRRLLQRCAFCLFAVLVGNMVLLAVPQAREALEASLAPGAAGAWQTGCFVFVLAVLYWAMTAWLVARLLLSRRFPGDLLGAEHDLPFVNWVAAVLPRVLAIGAILPVAVLTWQTNAPLGAITLGAGGAFIVLLVLRTRFGRHTSDKNIYASFDVMGPLTRQAVLGCFALSAVLLAALWHLPTGRLLAGLWPVAVLALRAWDSRRPWPVARKERQAELHEEARRGWSVVALSLGYAAGALVMVWRAPDEITMARQLASPALLLFALGSWTVFGGFVLTYWPMSHRPARGAPALAVLLFGLLSLFETHRVAQRDLGPSPPGLPAAPLERWRADRPTLTARFDAWLNQVPGGDPVYLVAAVGGASRAAYWTGVTLATLEDDARAAQRRFGANVFAISGISGGSLGATAFVAALAQYPPGRGCAAQDRVDSVPPATDAAGARSDGLTPCVSRFLAGDFLAPIVGRMLFPDLFIRFLPVLPSWAARADRSLGLEDAWAQDWAEQQGDVGTPVSWRRPITELYLNAEQGGPPRLPTLLLNTVRLEDGQRFVQAPVQVQLPAVQDLLNAELDTARLSLTQAVHNSARFPYVSPAGRLYGRPVAVQGAADAKRPELGRLGDAGYHEASGAATLVDLLEALIERGRLRRLPDQPGLWACRDGWAAPRPGAPTPRPVACASPPSRMVAMVLDSEPATFPATHVRDLKGAPLHPPQGQAADGIPLSEVLAPVFGGLSTRTQLGRLSQQRLARLVGDDADAFIELRLPWWRLLADERRQSLACSGHLAQPSMTWKLDDCTLERMRLAAQGRPPFIEPLTLDEQSLLANHQRARAWIGRSAAEPGARP